MMPRVGEGSGADDFGVSQERSRRRREEQRRRARRRRRLLIGIGGAAAVATAAGVAVSAGAGRDGHASDSAHAAARPLAQLPGGGRTILPGRRVVAFYGTSGTSVLGVLGAGTPDQAAARLLRQARAYRRPGRPVMPAFEYIATVASSAPGADGLYRTPRPLAQLHSYLAAARRIHALFLIDVQPGLGDFAASVRPYADLLRDPDVSLALDPEWKTDAGQVPGQVIGHTDAATVNRVSTWLARIVRAHRLPQKILLVHQFTDGMVRQRERILPRRGLAVIVNVDGFGDRPNKLARYRSLAPRRRLYPGFKLFYTKDTGLLRPSQVLRLRPAPVFVVYQ
jgi:hypothetical protein